MEKVQVQVQVRIDTVAENFTCPLCESIMVQPTKINLCMHTFCKKCIYQKLENEDEDEDEDEKCCPVCKVGLGIAPLETLRADHTLHSLREKIFSMQSENLKGTGSNENISESASSNKGRKRKSSSRGHGNSAQPGQIWVNLLASPDKEENELPQVSSGLLKLKDDHLPVPYIQKYLKKKLNLKSETEVEILMNGETISPALPVNTLLEQWQQTRSPSYSVQEVKFLLEVLRSNGC